MFLKLEAKHFLIAIFVSLMIPLSFEKPYSHATPTVIPHKSEQNDKKGPIFIGVNVRGYYTNLQYERYPNFLFPENYYDTSFRLIRDAGMNLVRYVFYWEAYEKKPDLFIQELDTVAKSADRYGIKVIYDNHQYQTSSWLDPKNGTGFPETLFQNVEDHRYDKGSGGKTHHESSKLWWTNWWDRSIRDSDGAHAWELMSEFLKKIVKTVNNHTSTLGYEILNEPQIHNDNQWEKVGEFNTFMVKELRELTQKTIVFSQQIPGSKHSDVIELTPENIAKMAPDDKNNTVFKFTLYRLPEPGGYHDDRFKTYLEAGKISDIPVMIGEWNNVERVKVEETDDDGNRVELYKVDAKSSDIDQRRATFFVDKFEKSSVWGWAYWNWNYIPNPVAPTNLLTVTPDAKIQPTKYLEVLKNAISEIYGERTE